MRYLAAMAPSTAASRSASSKTMNGALPPSSSERRFTVGADCAIRMRPTSVDPVNDSLRTMGLPVSTAPMVLASPVTTWSTPAGMPARCASSASAKADSGVSSAGLMTMAHPAAKAGPALRVIIAAGKFHGVMAAQTPTGWRSVTRRLSAAGVASTSPSTRLASSANHSIKLAAYAISPRASASGLPCSRVIR
ncbi:hypothetical protein D3C87_1385220 [compost metagenome]